MDTFKEALLFGSLEESKIVESPVGTVGRTGANDAKAHVNAELRAEFKKIVKKLGGKTVARQLLAEMNAGGVLEEAISKEEKETRALIIKAFGTNTSFIKQVEHRVKWRSHSEGKDHWITMDELKTKANKG